MINLTEIWVAAGKPEGRAPSNYKATAEVKRQIKLYGYSWVVQGRGAKATTWAAEALEAGYAAYVQTAKKGRTSKAKAEPRAEQESKSQGRFYTDEEIAQIKNMAETKGYFRGFQNGHDMGKASSFSKPGNWDDVKRQCANARKTFARKYHPDVAGGDTRTMQGINIALDEVEKIFNQAA